MYSSIVSSLTVRMSRVQAASSRTFKTELVSLRDFIRRTGPLLAISKSIEAAAPGFDPSAWEAQIQVSHGRNFPTSEPEYMKLLQYLISRFVADLHVQTFTIHVFGEGQANLSCSRVANELVLPYVTYLIEGLGTESEILYTIARYTQRTGWFTRDVLFAAYEADTKRGEALYDRDLRSFLFDQGIDNPFSAPNSPSGRADVVALLHTTDPLVCEVKLYDGSRYGVPYVAKGVKQAHRYARDYGKSAAHLVVFNLSDETLQLPNDHFNELGPPSLSIASVRVYLHVVQAKPLGPASEPGKIKTRPVMRSDLVQDLETETGPEA